MEIAEDTNSDGTINASEVDGDANITISIESGVVVGDKLNLTVDGTNSEVEITQGMIDAGEYKTAVSMPEEGQELEVSANYTDAEGNTTASTITNIEVDTLYGDDIDEDGEIDSLAIELTEPTNEAFTDIIGTIGEGAKSLDSLIITDKSDNELIIDISDVNIDINGAYSLVDVDLSSLEDGDIVITALSTDNDGNKATTTNTQTKAFDTLSPKVTITEDANNDRTINTDELKSQIDTKITFSDETEIGDTLTITNPDGSTTDKEITQAMLDEGYNISYDAPDEGESIVIKATVTNADGEESRSSRDIATIDTIYGDDVNNDGTIEVNKVDIVNAMGNDVLNSEEVSNLTIVGTLGEAGVSLESVTISDKDENEIEVDLADVIINSDGTYSLKNIDISSLIDGNITVSAHSIDSDGNSSTIDSISTKDTLYGNDGDDNNNNVTPAEVMITDASGDNVSNASEIASNTIAGSIGEGGSILESVKIVDESGKELDIELENVELNKYGEYSIENVDLSSLTDGELTIYSSSIDVDGNRITKTDSIHKDIVYGDDGEDNDSEITPVAINITDSNNNSIIDSAEVSNSIISGTIGEGASSLDSLIISDELGKELALSLEGIEIADDGTYSIENVDLSSLSDGELTLSASSTDNDGNKAFTTTTIDKDIVYGDDGTDDGSDITPVNVTINDENNNRLIIDSEISHNTINGTIGEGALSLDSLIVLDELGNELALDTLDVEIADDGTYSINSVDLSSLSDGMLTLTASSTDNDGNKAITTATIEKDVTYGDDGDDDNSEIVSAKVEINTQSDYDIINSNELKISDISGTIGEGASSLDSLIISDESGHQEIIELNSITLNDDGTYLVSDVDLSDFADGKLTIVASSTDNDGNSISVRDEIMKDVVYGDDGSDDDYTITNPTLDITDESANEVVVANEVMTSDISGTIGEGAKTLDSFVITDETGYSQSLNVASISVGDDGTYRVEDVDLSAFSDGTLTIQVSSTDNDGNNFTVTDTIEKDIVYGDDSDDEGTDITPASIGIIDENSDTVLNDSEIKLVDIQGSIGENASSLDSLIISDSKGNFIDIDLEEVSWLEENGSYSVSDIDLSLFSEGALTITAKSTDNDGNTITTTDSMTKDTIYGLDASSVNVDISDSSNDDIVNSKELQNNTITGSIGEEGKTLDSLTVTDSDGTSLELDLEKVSLLEDDGSYKITDVDLSTLNDGQLTIQAISTDNDGNTIITDDIISKDVMYGDDLNKDGIITAHNINISEDSDDNIINAHEHLISDISGHIGEAGITLDSLTITDKDGTELDIDVSGVVIEEGAYSIQDVDLSSLADGELTLKALSTDRDGNIATSFDTIMLDTLYGDDSDDDGSDITPASVALEDDGNNDSVINKSETTNKISGTIGEGGATLDKLIITDESGNEVQMDVANVNVEDDGSYSVTDINLSVLSDGILTITASSTDVDGNTTTVTNSIEKDIVYGDDTDDDGETVLAGTDMSVLDDDNKVDIAGTIGEGGVTLDSLVITDIDNNTVTIDQGDITKDNDGSYHIEGVNVQNLVDGKLIITASSTDIDGNTIEIIDVEYKNVLAEPLLTLSDDINNDGTINQIELVDDKVNAKITFHHTTESGYILNITDANGDDSEVEITQDMIDAGEYIFSCDAPDEGENIELSATISYDGEESEGSSDLATIDTIAGDNSDGSSIAPIVTITEDKDNDTTVNSTEKDGALNISISIEEGVVEGDILTIVTDNQEIKVEVTQAMIDDSIYLTTVDMPQEAETLTVSATITDVEGNTSESGSDTITVDTIAGELADNVEIQAPIVTITEDINSDGIINATEKDGDANISISIEEGVVEGDILNLTINGTTTEVEITQDMIDNALYETTTEMPEENKELNVSATVTDSEGNTTQSGENSARVDTIYGKESDTNVNLEFINTDNKLNSSESIASNISGTIGESGAKLDSLIVVDSDEHSLEIDISDVIINDDGTYIIEGTDLSSLADGELIVTASSTDTDGNSITSSDTIIKDTVYGNDGDDDGEDITPATLTVSDEIINANELTSTTIQGTIGEGGKSLDKVIIEDRSNNTLLIDISEITLDDGSYTIENIDISSLDDGTLTVIASSTDVDGNTTDTVTTIVKDTVINVTIDSIEATADNTPSITGTVDSDASEVVVKITDEEGTTLSFEAELKTEDSLTTWSIESSELKDGQYSVKVIATDKAGNIKEIEETDGFTIDSTAEVTIDTISDNNITSQNALIFTGTVDGAIKSLEVTINNVTYDMDSEELSADDEGKWTLDISSQTLKDSEYELEVNYIDTANNSASVKQTITVDSNEPLTLEDFTLDGTITNDSTIKFEGTLENATQVIVTLKDSNDNITELEATINDNGTWEVVTDALGDDDYSVAIVATDVAGNIETIEQNFTVDTTDVISLSIDDKNDDAENAQIVTNDTSPTFSGTVVNSTDVNVIIRNDDDEIIWEKDVDKDDIDTDNNSWSIQVPEDELNEETYFITVTATKDGADDVKIKSDLVIDLTDPEITIETIDGVNVSSDAVDTNNPIAKITGTKSSDTVKVIITIEGSEYEAGLTENGWEFNVPENLSLVDGNYEFTATAYDNAGNSVQESNEFKLDMTPPEVTIDAIEDGDDQTPTFTGTVSDDGVKVIVTIDGNEYEATIDDTNWKLTLSDEDALDEGDYSVKVTAYDHVGNAISQNENFNISIDAQPEVEITTQIVATDDVTPIFEGTTNHTTTLTLNINGKDYDVDLADDGTWSFELPEEDALENGTYTVKAIAEDDDNQGTTIQEFVIDTQATYGVDSVIEGRMLYNKDGILDSDAKRAIKIASEEDGTNSQTVEGNRFTTALGGTIILNEDGTFSYDAPIFDHSDEDVLEDYFYFKDSDGTTESEWTRFNIDVNDMTPDAQDDSNIVAYQGEVGGNLIANDLDLVDSKSEMVKVIYNDVDYEFGDESSISIDAEFGTLDVQRDGTYSYSSSAESSMVSNKVGDEDDDTDEDTFGVTDAIDIQLGAFGDETKYLKTDDNGDLVTDNNGNVILDLQKEEDGDTDSSTKESDINDDEAEEAGIDSGDADMMGGDGTKGYINNVNDTDNQEGMVIDMKEDVYGLKLIFAELGLDDGNGGSGDPFQAKVTLFDAEGGFIKEFIVDGVDGGKAVLEVENTIYKYIAVTAIDDAEFAISEVAYTPKATEVDTFTYQMIDSDGDTSSADLSVAHTNATNETAVDDITTIDESSIDNLTGNLLDNDEGLIDESVESISSNGIVYEANEDGVIIIDNAMSHLEVQSDGEYTYTLKSNTTQNIDDTISFEYTLTNGSKASLTVNVTDDVPVVLNNPVEVFVESSDTDTQSYNVTLVIDKSGSMSIGMNPMDMSGNNRMDATKDAINNIVEQYGKLGEVNVNIIDFSDSVSTSGWFIDNENGMKDYINFIEPDGEAYYNDAIEAVMNSDEAPQSDNNILYFITDGAPTAGHTLDDTLEAEWAEYRDENFDEVYAVASGGSWLNMNFFDMDATLDSISGDSANSFSVASVSDLEATLLSTIDSDKKVSGDLIDDTNNAMFNFGADGGHISSIIIDSKEYSYNEKSGDKITVTTSEGAILTLDFISGEYTYQANLSEAQEGAVELITIVGVDGDGDKVESELIINLDTNATQTTNNDLIITNITQGSFEIPAFTLLMNDNPSIMNGFNDTKTVDMELQYDESGMFLVEPTKDFEYDFGTEMSTFDKADEDLDIARTDFGHVADESSIKDATLPTVQVNGELSENDTDMIALDLQEGEWLVLDIDNANEEDGADTTLILYTKDTEGNLTEVVMNTEAKIVSGGSGSTDKQDPFLSYQVQSDAEYVVKVTNEGESDGTYALMLSIVPALDDMKFEYTTEDGQGSVVNFLRTASQTLYGSDKSEILLANEEETTLIADAGDDTLVGGTANDTLYGDDGADALVGNEGDDLLYGGADNDTLDGGSGSDILQGESGHDRLDGGLGADNLYGGSGNDTLVYDAGDTIIDGGTDSDSLIVNEDIDFTNLDNIKDIEVVDIRTQNVKVTLNLDSLINMTDEDNTITIFGDKEDSLTLDNGDGKWVFEGQEHNANENITLNIYEQNGAIVKVDDEIDIGIVN